ncbi:MAG TPA: transglutaminase domain-containing protein [Gemmataceae bacterium]|nr:transglutaminase domain-containing protein [Gemmataceae bacterium]
MSRHALAVALAATSLIALAGGTLAGRNGRPAKPALDPQLPYQARRSNPVNYEVDYAVTVTAPYHTKVLKVWLPLPQTDAGQQVEETELTTFPLHVTPAIAREPVFGNRFAYFEFHHPEGAQIIRHKFKVKLWELRWDVDPGKVVQVERWPAGFDKYLRGDRSVVVDDRVRRLAGEIVPKRGHAASDMAAVMAWVNEHMTYNHAAASLRASAIHALEKRTGHCSDYHGLCAAFGRALGSPTRVTYGINAFPKNSPSHCKLEVYLPPYGWVSFDVAETQHLIGAIQKNADIPEQERTELVRSANARLGHGFRDNTWFLQTRGTDYDLAPPARQRVPVVRTIYAEADGEALPEPDPANPHQREFAWMTSHDFKADKTVPYPFKDWKTLLDKR